MQAMIEKLDNNHYYYIKIRSMHDTKSVGRNEDGRVNYIRPPLPTFDILSSVLRRFVLWHCRYARRVDSEL